MSRQRNPAASTGQPAERLRKMVEKLNAQQIAALWQCKEILRHFVEIPRGYYSKNGLSPRGYEEEFDARYSEWILEDAIRQDVQRGVNEIKELAVTPAFSVELREILNAVSTELHNLLSDDSVESLEAQDAPPDEIDAEVIRQAGAFYSRVLDHHNRIVNLIDSVSRELSDSLTQQKLFPFEISYDEAKFSIYVIHDGELKKCLLRNTKPFWFIKCLIDHLGRYVMNSDILEAINSTPMDQSSLKGIRFRLGKKLRKAKMDIVDDCIKPTIGYYGLIAPTCETKIEPEVKPD